MACFDICNMRFKTMILAATMLLAGAQSFAVPEDFEKISDRYTISFSYDGKAFDPSAWSASAQTVDSKTVCASYTSPDGKLLLKLTYVRWPDYPVVEVRPELECIGDAPTGIIDDFKSLDYKVASPRGGVKIRRISGSATLPTDFSRHDVQLQNRGECNKLSMSNPVGRGTDWLPYIGVDYDDLHGVEVAIGWTGTWKAEMSCGPDFRFCYGLDGGTHFRMLPGEHFKMPYTVIYEREGKNVEDGMVELHRFIIEHKTPRDARGNIFKPLLPLTASGGNKTDANMLTILENTKKAFPDIPFDAFWVDAGWFGAPHEVDQDSNVGPYWFYNVGYWQTNTWAHPDGNMKKVARAANRKGMKFLLWFEPERATLKSPIVNEHPEYFHRQKTRTSLYLDWMNLDDLYLLDMGNPDARKWITDEVSRNIVESEVEIYRQDFNMNPAPVWRENDEPDRKGVLEIRHINGLYEFWDELHRRFPDLMFENCAGGGTRMDIEMMSRAHSYCRDDAHMFKGLDELCQNITLNTTSYIPFTGGETFSVPVFDTYGWLSHMAAGTVFTPADFQGMFFKREPSKEETAWFHDMLRISDRVRPYFFGDFYVLEQPAFDNSACYVAYQLNDPKSGDGFFIAFRREKCLEDSIELHLRGIDPDALYSVEEPGGDIKTMKGCELSRQILKFADPRTARIFFYSKTK